MHEYQWRGVFVTMENSENLNFYQWIDGSPDMHANYSRISHKVHYFVLNNDKWQSYLKMCSSYTYCTLTLSMPANVSYLNYVLLEKWHSFLFLSKLVSDYWQWYWYFTFGFLKLLSSYPIHIVVWGNFSFNWKCMFKMRWFALNDTLIKNRHFIFYLIIVTLSELGVKDIRTCGEANQSDAHHIEPSNPSIFCQISSFEIFTQCESMGSTTYVVKFSYSNSF